MSGNGNGKEHVCPGCGQAFATEEELAKHLKTSQAGPPEPEEVGMKMGVELGKKLFEEQKRVSEELSKKVLCFSVAGGLLTVECTGSGVFTAFRVDPSLLAPDKGGDLEVYLVTAANGAMGMARKEAEKMMNETIGKTLLAKLSKNILK